MPGHTASGAHKKKPDVPRKNGGPEKTTPPAEKPGGWNTFHTGGFEIAASDPRMGGKGIAPMPSPKEGVRVRPGTKEYRELMETLGAEKHLPDEKRVVALPKDIPPARAFAENFASADLKKRAMAQRALRTLKEQGNIRLLMKYLEPQYHPAVRMEVAYLLGEAKHREAAPSLMRSLLEDRNHLVRAASAISLGLMQYRDAAPKLRIALQDHFPAVRERAAYALARIGDRDARPFLRELAKADRHEAVRIAAAFALRKIGGMDGGKAPGQRGQGSR